MAVGNQNVVSIVIRAFDQTKSGLTTPIRNLQDLEKAAGKLKPAFVAMATAAAAAFGALIKHQIDAADEAGKLSQKVAVSVRTLTGLSHAMDLAGGDSNTLKIGLKGLNTLIANAASGNELAENSFRQVGIAFTDVNGKARSTEAVLADVADLFARSEDGAGKSALAVQLFGKSGLDLIPFLNEGSEGLAEMRAEAEALGLTFDKDTTDAAESFNDSLTRLKGATMGTVNTFVVAFIPTLAAAAEGTFEWVKQSGVMQGIALTLIQIFRGLAVSIRAVYDAVVSGLEVIAALATILGFVMVNAAEASVKSFKAFGVALGVSASQSLELIKSLGQLAGIMGRIIKGDFSGAWDDFSLLVDDIDIRIRGIGKTVGVAFKEVGSAVRTNIKKDIDDAVAIGGELGSRLQKRWSDFGAFTFDVFSPAAVDAPKMKGVTKGQPITLTDDSETKRQIALLEKMNEQARKQAELFRTLAQEGLRGSAALTAAEENRYAKQLEQIDKAGLDEDDYYRARESAAANHQQILTEQHAQGLMARADLDQIQREGDIAALVAFQDTQQAAELADLEARQGMIQALHDMWQNSFFVKISTTMMNFSVSVAQNLSQSFGSAVASLAAGAATLGQAVKSLWTSMVGGMAQYFAQLTANTVLYALLSKSIGAATTAATMLMIAPIAGAWAAAATAASIATFGGAVSAAALVPPAMVANAAFAKGFAVVGGVAHDGMMNVPADGSYVLQGGEMVVARDDSSRLIEYLESQGGSPRTIVVNVGDRELFKLIEDGSRDGRLQLA